jgi:hypothetical protein
MTDPSSGASALIYALSTNTFRVWHLVCCVHHFVLVVGCLLPVLRETGTCRHYLDKAIKYEGRQHGYQRRLHRSDRSPVTVSNTPIHHVRTTYRVSYLATSPSTPAHAKREEKTETCQLAHLSTTYLLPHLHLPSIDFSSSSNNPRIFPLSSQESLCHTRKLRLRLISLLVLSSRQEYRTGILATNPPHRCCVLRVLFRLVLSHYLEVEVLLRAPYGLAVGL